MTDDTAKAILAVNEIICCVDAPTPQKINSITNNDLQAMARLWLLLPEIRQMLDDLTGLAEDDLGKDVTECRILLAKLFDESLQGKRIKGNGLLDGSDRRRLRARKSATDENRRQKQNDRRS